MHRALVAAALVGCYHPAAETACAISCPCPSSLECGPDLLCHEPGAPACSAQRADGGVDGPDAPQDSSRNIDDAGCYGVGLNVHLCTLGTIPRSFSSGTVISTDSACDYLQAQGTNQPMLCVIAGTNIDFIGYVSVIGSRPVVFFATGSITIPSGALVRAGSYSNGMIGPNANYACAATTIDGANGVTTTGAGGGAGGSYQGLGGNGGPGGNTTNDNGTAASEDKPTFVRGGCHGGSGGPDAFTVAGGLGGSSGGAIYLLAGNMISIAGTLDASGQGGAAATYNSESGGGGGGAGGLIALDAPTIALTGLVLASGGGGGGGGGGASNGLVGGDGADPTTTNPAAGGNGAGNGGPGGNGSSRGSNDGVIASAGAGGTRGCGGGGGGGAAGWIFVFPSSQPIADTNIAPVPL